MKRAQIIQFVLLLKILLIEVVGKTRQPSWQRDYEKSMKVRDDFINNRIRQCLTKKLKTNPKTFQQLYSIIKFPQIPVASFMRSYDKTGFHSEYESQELIKANDKQLENREALLNKLNKDLGVPIPLEYIKGG